MLDRTGFCRVEPALAYTQEKFVGALRLPNDETGDCFKFTQRHGASFRFDTSIEGFAIGGGRISGVRTGTGLIQADAYVCALGSYSPLMLKPIGIDLPVYPVKGYSITVPITNASRAPE